MKRKIVFGGISIALIGLIAYYIILYIPKDIDTITVKSYYMMYACGDCYPQYKVKEVLKPDNKYSYLVDKLIDVKYESEALEQQINKQTEQCVICYDFFLTGRLKYSKSKGYSLEVDSARAILRSNDCCDSPTGLSVR
ncbi:MAG: hypothetical protein V4714_11670 [Bacteroidota bacterium]